MGAGIRPEGHFSYASLRHKSVWPACGYKKMNLPDQSLCENCAHTECKQKGGKIS